MKATDFNDAIVEMKPGLEHFACQLTRNKEDALDLLQDTYLRALTFRDKFEEDISLKGWIFTIMKNTFFNENRRVKKKKTVFDSNTHHCITNKQYIYSEPESYLSYNEISSKVEELEDEHKVPFQMYIAGYKYREIAEQINLNIGTVKSRIYFSRQKLMSKLQDYQDL